MANLPSRLTWTDVVRQEMGESLPDGVVGHILWNETAFPFAGVEHIRKQIREFRDGRRQEEVRRVFLSDNSNLPPLP